MKHSKLKQHYKMYKSGKHWVYMGITILTVFSVDLAVANVSASASTPDTPSQTFNTESSDSLASSGQSASDNTHTSTVSPHADTFKKSSNTSTIASKSPSSVLNVPKPENDSYSSSSSSTVLTSHAATSLDSSSNDVNSLTSNHSGAPVQASSPSPTSSSANYQASQTMSADKSSDSRSLTSQAIDTEQLNQAANDLKTALNGAIKSHILTSNQEMTVQQSLDQMISSVNNDGVSNTLDSDNFYNALSDVVSTFQVQTSLQGLPTSLSNPIFEAGDAIHVFLNEQSGLVQTATSIARLTELLNKLTISINRFESSTGSLPDDVVGQYVQRIENISESAGSSQITDFIDATLKTGKILNDYVQTPASIAVNKGIQQIIDTGSMGDISQMLSILNTAFATQYPDLSAAQTTNIVQDFWNRFIQWGTSGDLNQSPEMPVASISFQSLYRDASWSRYLQTGHMQT
ncbi:KxYKxGKxW signal peptide domain-containing protein [Furfurilactobacillus milii]|uniref:KxYKxGKxW signal peptide domain-containing protein n=1 Tax=Furfurilactobacillus milii TaxID=2888272 RepID=A0ABT6DBH7_9LACO|nr:KxYKxGKxW signal peptide domain-containing protein [Furfurilactobacillus milii]QLE65573.1 hypothetical protein LROSL2_0220 [Furfurilactobacillus rossiae]MCF6161159.1 KxYKxGKxW signal peptide domain-containing protein [Furfurilactobacillus milii]MCF6163586.1 KxYKxGKxW signal peptide domain-containing protein [Furfurilactobacillus milii]MDF9913873.1 KxYKxGKxW signal peptide domain-containing protein [Furfurilactobacillus milii]QLE68003.1 hypothetical protein LROSL3_0221 [Furfurilactobacillus 